jgi:hypothetical protein
MPSSSHHVVLVFYANEMDFIATAYKPTLLVGYLEAYLNELQRRLIRESPLMSNNAIIFAHAGRFIQTRPITLFGERIQWVDTTCYLG